MYLCGWEEAGAVIWAASDGRQHRLTGLTGLFIDLLQFLLIIRIIHGELIYKDRVRRAPPTEPDISSRLCRPLQTVLGGVCLSVLF